MSEEKINQKAVKSSITFGFIIAIIGMITGFLISSQAIFFAAIASLIGAIITFIPLAVLKFIEKRDDRNYPFGKEALEPLIAITQYIPLLIICIYNIFSAIQVIFGGGNMVSATSGILYGLFSTLFSMGVSWYLIYLTKEYSSPIAKAEAIVWQFESAIGIGILLGFGIAYLLNKMSLTALMPYVDPVLTLIIFLIFSITTIMVFRDCVKELMQSSPPNDIISIITEKVEKVDCDYDFSDKILRLSKVGSKVVIEIDYVVLDGSRLDSISEQDQLRKLFTQACAELPHKIWMNISFTSDIKLTEHIVPQRCQA